MTWLLPDDVWPEFSQGRAALVPRTYARKVHLIVTASQHQREATDCGRAGLRSVVQHVSVTCRQTVWKPALELPPVGLE